MKSFFLLGAFEQAFSQMAIQAENEISNGPDARLYWQMTQLMETFNPDFNRRKYWVILGLKIIGYY